VEAWFRRIWPKELASLVLKPRREREKQTDKAWATLSQATEVKTQVKSLRTSRKRKRKRSKEMTASTTRSKSTKYLRLIQRRTTLPHKL
jgi:hypothetical protein